MAGGGEDPPPPFQTAWCALFPPLFDLLRNKQSRQGQKEHGVPETRCNGTSLWNRDDCVRVLLRDSDCSVGDLCEQVHDLTHTIVSNTPVPREAPEEQNIKKKIDPRNLIGSIGTQKLI